MRLSDGRIGRVQSLGAGGSSTAPTGLPQAPDAGVGDQPTGGRRRNLYEAQHTQADAWPKSERATSTSLMDYVKSNNTSRKLFSKGPLRNAQEYLEKKFPHLDSGLIAAILSDYSTVEAAEEVLGALDTT